MTDTEALKAVFDEHEQASRERLKEVCSTLEALEKQARTLRRNIEEKAAKTIPGEDAVYLSFTPSHIDWLNSQTAAINKALQEHQQEVKILEVLRDIINEDY